MTRKTLFFILGGIFAGVGLGLAFLLILDLWTFGRPSARTQNSSIPAVPEINSPAQEFTLNDLEGQSIHLSDFRGKVVLINFWATWCGPCKLEMPLLQKYAGSFSNDIAVLAINEEETADKVTEYISQAGLKKLTVLLDDDGQVGKMYRLRAFPTTYFVDQAGIVRYLHLGILSEDQLKSYLMELGVAN